MTDPNFALKAGVTFTDEDDWAMLHYATGILIGLGHKYGLTDVTIYHDDVRVQITPGVSNVRERSVPVPTEPTPTTDQT